MIAKYSKTGKKHSRVNAENQDCLIVKEDEDFYFCAIADGVSTQSKSGRGAELACNVAARIFMRSDRFFLSRGIRKSLSLLVNEIVYEIEKLASSERESIHEYASTLLFVLIDRKTGEMLVCNLGDGRFYISDRSGVYSGEQRCEPSGGTYATTTKNVVETISAIKTDVYAPDSIVLMSDGAWRHIYHNGKIKDEIVEIIKDRKFTQLEEFFDHTEKNDDCSYVCVDLKAKRLKGDFVNGRAKTTLEKW